MEISGSNVHLFRLNWVIDENWVLEFLTAVAIDSLKCHWAVAVVDIVEVQCVVSANEVLLTVCRAIFAADAMVNGWEYVTDLIADFSTVHCLAVVLTVY